MVYDPAGNITQVEASLAGGMVGNQCFGYDYQQQLTEAWTPNSARCDPSGRSQAGSRILRKQGDTTTLFVGGDEISLNTTTNTVTANRYYTHAGQTVAVRTGASNDTVTNLIADWQGTTHHQISNATGTGQRAFVGGTKDATGLTRMGARDYDPALQRFITIDPLENLNDPLQWNPYLYANNTPITASDPTGLAMLIDGIYKSHRHQEQARQDSPQSQPHLRRKEQALLRDPLTGG